MKRVVPVLVATILGLGLLATFKTSPGASTKSIASRLPKSTPTTAPPPSSAQTSPRQGSSTPTSPQISPQTTTPSTSSNTRTVTGDDEPNRYGDVQVQVTVRGNKLVDVEAVQLPTDRPRSAEISSEAGPILRQEALQAGSAQIDIVSGATFTSESYASSLQSALDKAGV